MMEDGIALRRHSAAEMTPLVLQAIGLCEAALRRGGKLFFCGNGGSAADAQHLATELLVRLRSRVERPSWPAIALTLDPAALTAGGFDAAFGGARRDEEKSRAKERVFSFRDRHHRWDPKNQRPELWNLFNTRIHEGESIRVFPMSNWTELDVWLYVWKHGLPVVPLYLAKPRPVVERGGTLIMVDDDRLPLEPGEKPRMLSVRFRTLGCYPLSGAVESEADTLDKVIEEMLRARTSERQGRLIDHDQSGSMEEKKREGYF